MTNLSQETKNSKGLHSNNFNASNFTFVGEYQPVDAKVEHFQSLDERLIEGSKESLDYKFSEALNKVKTLIDFFRQV